MRSSKAVFVADQWSKLFRISAASFIRVVSHPEAGAELDAAALRNEERQPGLGDAFVDEFEGALRRIVAEPERWRIIQGKNRKLSFHRFPFAVVYRVHTDVLYAIAVMHLHRRPFYWAHRRVG